MEDLRNVSQSRRFLAIYNIHVESGMELSENEEVCKLSFESFKTTSKLSFVLDFRSIFTDGRG